MDFGFSTADEIARELCERLKAARLAFGLQQAELAERAGVSRRTITTLERSGQSTLASFIRVIQALGLESQLQELFKLKSQSIAELERNEQSTRKRAPRKAKVAAS